MARATIALIEGIRRTARKLKRGAPYAWGHMGSCNCGNLAQELTGLSKSEIHQYAMEKYGDWTEQCRDYCPTSGYPMDLLISKLLEKGLSLQDLKHLEKLSDKSVLERLPEGQRFLRHNHKEDVILYLQAWADLLEEKLTAQRPLSESVPLCEWV